MGSSTITRPRKTYYPSPTTTGKRPRVIAEDMKVSLRASHELPESVQPTQPYVEAVRKLASSSGALGRGTRAALRAFYRRANFVLPRRRARPDRVSPIYVEIGPAYALTMAQMGKEVVTRYAVEQRAWPALRQILKWEELSTTDARKRGAPLRRLSNGDRFGRHIFLSYYALSAIIMIAEELLVDVSGAPDVQDAQLDDPLAAVLNVKIEAVIDLKRRPIAGVRTVAANCPRGNAHSNQDRNPSLVLWMNEDGVTGGAMCPVCMESNASSYSSRLGGMLATPRNMTWRVHYIQGNTAVLCTPHRRIQSPPQVGLVINEWQQRRTQENVRSGDTYQRLKTNKIPIVARHAFRAKKTSSPVSEKASTTVRSSESIAKKDSSVLRQGAVSDCQPVGGCVLKDRRRLSELGNVISLAYVTASLKVTCDTGISGMQAAQGTDSLKLRTVGTKAKHGCPMQILLWSDRRSKGPTYSQRVEDVSWFARQSLGNDVDDGYDKNYRESVKIGREDELESEEWLPTPVVSVSAMRPCGWREVMAGNGQLVSVPSGWEASAQAWVLFDIDDVLLLNDERVVEEVARKITLAIRRNIELSGRCLVMQTGPKGLHIWAELREVREDARAWFKKEETRRWYLDIGTKLLKAAHRGGASEGKIDLSSCCAGRFARRPGWRLLEDGTAFRSRVITYVPGRVKNRKPRF